MGGRCATCKHWNDDGDGVGVCYRLTDSDVGMITVLGTEGSPGISTGPDFGCVQWEASND